jgi:MOSC domain-containing protein YiiM
MSDAVTPPDPPRIVSVNVGLQRTLEWRGRTVTTGIWKAPVEGPVVVEGVNLHADDQADRRVHGGVDKAVYAYAVEDYRWWAEQGVPYEPGRFGENLTTAGIDLGACRIGDRWQVGTALLEVSQPRSPCFKLGIRMGDDAFPDRFAAAGRPGTYLRIVGAGEVVAGDAIAVEATHLPAVTVASLVADEIEPEVLRLAAGDERVPGGWRRHAERALR